MKSEASLSYFPFTFRPLPLNGSFPLAAHTVTAINARVCVCPLTHPQPNEKTRKTLTLFPQTKHNERASPSLASGGNRLKAATSPPFQVVPTVALTPSQVGSPI